MVLRCKGVSDQRNAQLGSSATLLEALGDLEGLFGFWKGLADSGALNIHYGRGYQVWKRNTNA